MGLLNFLCTFLASMEVKLVFNSIHNGSLKVLNVGWRLLCLCAELRALQVTAPPRGTELAIDPGTKACPASDRDL